MRNNKKRFIDLALVLVLVVLAIAAAFLAWRMQDSKTPTQNDEVATKKTTKIVEDQKVNAERVVHISIDGLRADYVDETHMPVLSRLLKNGAGTLNARTDPDFTKTLPNHTGQLTGRAALGNGGHGVDFNHEAETTIQDNIGYYVASVFDVVHDNGGSTVLFADKLKFSLYQSSWGDNGAPDQTDEDNGNSKIDLFDNVDSPSKIDELIGFFGDNGAPSYGFYHFAGPDTAGHGYGFGSPEYDSAIAESDRLIGAIVDGLEAADLADTTAIIVTADHGGTKGTGIHNIPTSSENYTIPFIVYGFGVSKGADLYKLNKDDRAEPGTAQIPVGPMQPIRSAEAANLALELLGLPVISGSIFNEKQDLDY